MRETGEGDDDDRALVQAADLGGGNCVHDAWLGMNTADCPRCQARRTLAERRRRLTGG